MESRGNRKGEFENSGIFPFADDFGDDFGDDFSVFRYDEEKKSYIADSYQEPYGSEYTQIVVKISGGNLAYMEYLCDGDRYELKFFDIGSTTVVFPETAE